jgi:hypothetical protein
MAMTDDARQAVARRARWNAQPGPAFGMARTLPDDDEDDDDFADEDEDFDEDEDDDDLDDEDDEEES